MYFDVINDFLVWTVELFTGFKCLKTNISWECILCLWALKRSFTVFLFVEENYMTHINAEEMIQKKIKKYEFPSIWRERGYL